MQSKNQNYLKSVVRTLVPVVVGVILSGLAQIGIEVDQVALSQVIDGVFVGGYYTLVRYAESRVPALGWLLGLPSPPEYPEKTQPRDE